MYHFDPSNPPTKAGRYANSGSSSRKKIDRQKSLNSSGKSSYRDNTNNNNTNINGGFESEKPVAHVIVNASSNVDDQTDMVPLDEPKNYESSDDVCTTKDDDDDQEDESKLIDTQRLFSLSHHHHHLSYPLTASQNEVSTQSTYLNTEEIMSPKLKNQSTSPNLPLNETIINEEEVSDAMRCTSTSCTLMHMNINIVSSILRSLSRQHQARLLKKLQTTTMPRKMKFQSQRPQQQRRPSKR